MRARWLALPLAGGILVASPSCTTDCGTAPDGSPSAAETGASNEATPDSTDGRAAADRRRMQRVVDFYPDLAGAVFTDAHERAHRLALVIGVFRDAPTLDRIDASRRAWIAALEPCWESLAFRRPPRESASEPDDAGTDLQPFEKVRRLEVDAGAGEGPATLSAADASTDSIAGAFRRRLPGLRAMELLLWGPREVEGSPRRHTAFEVGGGTSQSTMRRRRTLLQMASKLLPETLVAASSGWQPERSARAAFIGEKPRAALGTIVSRLRSLVRRIAERGLRRPMERRTPASVAAPYAQRSLSALIAATRGIRSAYLGRYERTDNSTIEGAGVASVVAPADSDLDNRVRETLREALEALRAVPKPMIEGLQSDEGREAIRRAADRIEAVDESLARVEETLGLD